jgi:LuxR family transcriptional regulator, maltose regulon positive regulatory protein
MSTALQQGLLALEALPQPRSPLPAAFILIGMAEACIEAENWPGARSYLKQARQITMGIPEFKGDVLFLIPVASAAFRRGREGVGLRVLKAALTRAREGGWLNALYWRPRQLTLLCAKALEAGLETDYVQTLVQRHDLWPHLPATLHGLNPPPLEIRTLGVLSILREGVQLIPSGAGGGKPLALLKALLVLGSKNVPEEAIWNLLWPESEGDKAAQSLKFTLHGLRKFLGIPGVFTVKGRTISLNPRVCRVDLTQFEQACVRVRKAQNHKTPITDQIALCIAAVALYKGDFMAQDPTNWLTTTRQKLKDHCLQVFARLVQLQDQSGQQDLAAASCEQALAIDPHREAFYKTLILIHVRSGRTAEAAAVLRRCRDIFHNDLGVPPSNELQRLVAGFG